MKKELFDLNFNELLKYPKDFTPKFRYQIPLRCSNFCTYCEKQLQCCSNQPPLMSHGCSIDEIKKIISEPFKGTDDRPIMFLLENPGGDYQNGCNIKYNGVEKNPPVNHFYFSPAHDIKKWPTTVEEVKPNPYGNYFAYLIKRHSLNNVYIANCIKCKYSGDMYKKTKKICVEKYLKEEIKIFAPQKIIVFGRKAESILYSYISELNCDICYLWHPAARRSRKNIIEHNDKILVEFLRII